MVLRLASSIFARLMSGSSRLDDLRRAYGDVRRNAGAPELIEGPSVIKGEGHEY